MVPEGLRYQEVPEGLRYPKDNQRSRLQGGGDIQKDKQTNKQTDTQTHQINDTAWPRGWAQ